MLRVKLIDNVTGETVERFPVDAQDMLESGQYRKFGTSAPVIVDTNGEVIDDTDAEPAGDDLDDMNFSQLGDTLTSLGGVPAPLNSKDKRRAAIRELRAAAPQSATE